MASPRRCLYLLLALHLSVCGAGPLGPLPNVTSLDLGLKEGSCALGDVVYMSGDEFPGAAACERCTCARGEVRCERQRCEPRPGCKAVHRPDHCCPTYQCECEQEGRVYGNGEKLVDPQDPCRVCYCQGGEMVCRRIACFVRDDCQPRLVTGRCCPEYDNCPLRGVTSVHGMTPLPSTPPAKVNHSAALAPAGPVKPGFTIKEITPVSEIPVITDVKIKESLPSPNMDVAEYSSSKSPLIPREVTSEKSSDAEPSAKADPSAGPEKADLKTYLEENSSVREGGDSTPSKISFSTQDSINSDIYPSNIPSIILMGPPAEPISLSPLATKAPMMEEEDPSLFDHNPAFPPIPDDLSVLGNREDEILPEQHFESDHVSGTNDVVMGNEKVLTESPTTLVYVAKGISLSTDNSPIPGTSSDQSVTEKGAVGTDSTSTKENPMINLRSVLPTQILNVPSLISDDTRDDSTTEIAPPDERHLSTEKRIDVIGEHRNNDDIIDAPQTTEIVMTYAAAEVSSAELFSDNRPSSILIETSDQNPHDVSDRSLENTMGTSTTNPLNAESVTDIGSLSKMEPGKDTSLESMETTEFLLAPFGSQESVTDGIELIAIPSGAEKSSALIEPPRGRKNNVLTDLINLVGDVASISAHTEAPDHAGFSSTTISDSEELIPVNVGYKSKNNNWNVNSITEVPLKSKSQSPSKQKNVEIEDDEEVESITDSPPPNDKVEPTTKRPIIDNVADGGRHDANRTSDKKDIEIITQSYVPTINRRPTKVVLGSSHEASPGSAAGKPTPDFEDEKSTTLGESVEDEQTTEQPFDDSSGAQ